MSAARDRDLERWEHGGLSMSELVALHRSDGAAGLVVLHRRMSALGTRPVGDPEKLWHAIRERLPDVAGHRRTVPLRRRLTRPLAIAAAAVLIAGTAYAGSPDAVQRYLTSFWHTVQSILDVDAAANTPAEADRPSQGGGQGGRPAGVVDDAELEDRDEDGDQPGETSEGDDGADVDEAEGDDGDGSDDDDESTGDDDDGEPEDDEGDEPEDDDEPDDEQPENDGNEPEDDDEDD